jgi:hypothetical protein
MRRLGSYSQGVRLSSPETSGLDLGMHEDDLVTNNTKQPRTSGAISLGPTGTVQGNHKFMNLST